MRKNIKNNQLRISVHTTDRADDKQPAPENWPERLKKVRDLVLVFASLIYVLGYLSWAVFANEVGIGLIPVLDAQYFAAGAYPFLVLTLFFGGAYLIYLLSKWLDKPISPKMILLGKVILGIGVFTIFLRMLADNVTSLRFFKPEMLTFVGVLAIYVGAFFSRSPLDRFLHFVGKIVLWLYLLIGGLFLILHYLYELFPDLPQAFGGPKEQCVEFDLDSSDLSKSTQILLMENHEVGKRSADNDLNVVRSKRVYQLLESSDYLILKVPIDPEEQVVLKLPKGAIKSTIYCK